MKTLVLSFIFFFSFFHSKGLRAIGFEDMAFSELITTSRALGMGNAYLARVDDHSSAFYNPAGFGSIRNPHIHLSNFHIETNRGWLSSTTAGSATSSAGNFMKGFSLDGTRELLNENRGRIANSRMQFMPNFTTRFFSMGYMYSSITRATIGLEDEAPFEYATRRDHGPYTSLNISLAGGIFKLGATGVWLSRKEAFGEADPEDEIDLQREDYLKGQALVVISGAKLTLPVRWLPTIAARMNNSFDQKFSTSNTYLAAPETIKNSIDVGFSVTPKLSNLTWLHLEMNYKDVTSEYDADDKRRIALGAEIDIARRFYFRLGLADGFGSIGIGARANKWQFDITSYAVDSTASEFRGKEDRRFALTLSSGL